VSHPLRSHRKPHKQPAAWPSYRGTAQLVGSSPGGTVTVYVDPTLGAQGKQNATDLMNGADVVVNDNNAIFGTPGGPVSVIVFALNGATDGTGGADHGGCDYQTGNAIEVCAAFGNSTRVLALFEAELSECSMGGKLCGVSTGEALSRWCAAKTSNNALADFASAPDWANAGYRDYVNTTDPTDQNPVSTGCGMAFISWLGAKQGSSLSAIAQGLVGLGGQGTFAQLSQTLINNANPWPAFLADVQGLAGGVTSDNPFGATF